MNRSVFAAAERMDLGNVPIVVLGVYLCLLLGLGVYGFLKSKLTEEDYYLAGRQQGFIVTALTIMATFFSSVAMLGVPGTIYKEGVVFAGFALNLPLCGAAIYLLGSRIARVGRARGYVTPGDMVSEYYDGSSAVRLLVALLGFLYILPYVVLQMRAGGHLAMQLFPHAEPLVVFGSEFDVFSMGASVLSGVMLIYILVGGMRSVALADVIQGSLLLIGMLVAGFAVVSALGGIGGYAERVSNLPPEALTSPGATGRFPFTGLLTLCLFASLASMIQPAQWMRYYAARSARTLRRSALIFAIVLPFCFLAGVMLVGLGARSLYPPETVGEELVAHPSVGEWDQALVAVLRNYGPEVFGAAGALIVAVIMIAILAASMSTADSNLHALSAVFTRDVYDRFIRPNAGQAERAWVGRGVIVVAALSALWLVHIGEHNEDFEPLRMIVEMQIVAMAFSCQVLPVTIDILFVRRGTRAGAIAGMTAGLLVALLFSPLPSILLDETAGKCVATNAERVRTWLDVGFCGLLVNLPVFILVSAFTKRPDAQRTVELARIIDGK